MCVYIHIYICMYIFVDIYSHPPKIHPHLFQTILQVAYPPVVLSCKVQSQNLQLIERVNYIGLGWACKLSKYLNLK